MRGKAAPVPMVQNPMEGSPFRMYAAYPTQHLLPSTLIMHANDLDQTRLAALDALNGRALYRRKIATDAKTIEIAAFLATSGAITYAQLQRETRTAPEILAGIVMFLAKYDVVTLGPQAPK
jgi:hypothetical protein